MSALLDELQALETELHHPGRPCTLARLERLLHADFHEVGRSGRAYDRATVLAWLTTSQAALPDVASDGFRVERLAADTALLHFRSVLRDAGRPTQHTLRMSLWVSTAAGWQLRYHQGTPAAVPW
ncbi:DUF4440 domain-containing protein [Pseudorhodoferax sp. LjRoot39]|uniref:nuclear transport factor 2 family protein n=1 Tax=Pseudorhodoferax sp. LjRoot39 TaxID=3342328 RepID=UPI003ECEF9B0